MSAPTDPFVASLDGSPDAHGSSVFGDAVRGAPSVCVWGESRPVVNAVLYALARRVDREFIWLHVKGRTVPDPVDHLLAEDLYRPNTDAVAYRAENLLPGPTLRAASISWLVNFDDRPDELEQLRAFLTLPKAIQEIVSRHVPHRGPRVLAIPNSDRLAELFAGRPEKFEAILRVLKEISVSLMVGSAGANGPLRTSFDYSFEVRADNLGTWRDGSLVCERVPDMNGTLVGKPLPLGRLTWATEVLVAATEAVAGADPRRPA